MSQSLLPLAKSVLGVLIDKRKNTGQSPLLGDNGDDSKAACSQCYPSEFCIRVAQVLTAHLSTVPDVSFSTVFSPSSSDFGVLRLDDKASSTEVKTAAYYRPRRQVTSVTISDGRITTATLCAEPACAYADAVCNLGYSVLASRNGVLSAIDKSSPPPSSPFSYAPSKVNFNPVSASDIRLLELGLPSNSDSPS